MIRSAGYASVKHELALSCGAAVLAGVDPLKLGSAQSFIMSALWWRSDIRLGLLCSPLDLLCSPALLGAPPERGAREQRWVALTGDNLTDALTWSSLDDGFLLWGLGRLLGLGRPKNRVTGGERPAQNTWGRCQTPPAKPRVRARTRHPSGWKARIADLAHQVERLPCKQDARGSRPRIGTSSPPPRTIRRSQAGIRRCDPVGRRLLTGIHGWPLGKAAHSPCALRFADSPARRQSGGVFLIGPARR